MLIPIPNIEILIPIWVITHKRITILMNRINKRLKPVRTFLSINRARLELQVPRLNLYILEQRVKIQENYEYKKMWRNHNREIKTATYEELENHLEGLLEQINYYWNWDEFLRLYKRKLLRHFDNLGSDRETRQGLIRRVFIAEKYLQIKYDQLNGW